LRRLVEGEASPSRIREALADMQVAQNRLADLTAAAYGVFSLLEGLPTREPRILSVSGEVHAHFMGYEFWAVGSQLVAFQPSRIGAPEMVDTDPNNARVNSVRGSPAYIQLLEPYQAGANRRGYLVGFFPTRDAAEREADRLYAQHVERAMPVFKWRSERLHA
jgi:hypothetical protein